MAPTPPAFVRASAPDSSATLASTRIEPGGVLTVQLAWPAASVTSAQSAGNATECQVRRSRTTSMPSPNDRMSR